MISFFYLKVIFNNILVKFILEKFQLLLFKIRITIFNNVFIMFFEIKRAYLIISIPLFF